jgi:hypothetical protein
VHLDGGVAVRREQGPRLVRVRGPDQRRRAQSALVVVGQQRY